MFVNFGKLVKSKELEKMIVEAGYDLDLFPKVFRLKKKAYTFNPVREEEIYSSTRIDLLDRLRILNYRIDLEDSDVNGNRVSIEKMRIVSSNTDNKSDAKVCIDNYLNRLQARLY